ncbi:hypothetical protein HPP92_003621 [Vanilla planifolia]|uniref:Amino acid transporter transmembrane domain-containing protein n=1 Tax=Vanilla planifolia TaxID=51239 RepID=A0A835S245_VANPL|nr:hypothetical protein HPP92_003621 [Vanilla planifolia]
MEGEEKRASDLEGSTRRKPISSKAPYDDDGLQKRTGTLWTAMAHIVTAVIGSGVLSLAWAMAQLGWAFGPAVLIIFSLITLFTSFLLADCYRNSDPIAGKRNYNYMSAVKSNLGPVQIWMCGFCQYLNLCGTAVGYTITASISAAALKKSHCFHKFGHRADCSISYSVYMVGFGGVQLLLSQLPDLHNLWWLSVLASIMSFSYSLIGVGLALAHTISGYKRNTTVTGTIVGIDVTEAEKVWNVFNALGNIAFAYSYSMILIEIQNTLKSPPAENTVMKKASMIGILTTTTFYMLCGCLGYAAFGNDAPGNMLTGFGFYEPFWLIDVANICIVVHLLGAYQVFCQPVFAIVEETITKRWPHLTVLTNEITLMKLQSLPIKLNLLRLVWRTAFVVAFTDVHETEEGCQVEPKGSNAANLKLALLVCINGGSDRFH